MSEDSDKDVEKDTGSLKDKRNKNEEKEDYSKFQSIIMAFKEFVERTGQVDDPEKDEKVSGVSKSKTEPQDPYINSKVSSETSVSHEESKQDDYFPVKEQLLNYQGFRTLLSKKSMIMQAIALLIGAFLVIYGVINSFVPVERVADNVVFSERSTFSIFSILIGVLLMAAVFAQKLFSNTFLSKVHSELEAGEERQKVREDELDKDLKVENEEKKNEK